MAKAHHSGTLSHYRLPWRLLVVGFHPWPGASLFEQPEYLGLLHGTHIDGRLSADVPSTRCVSPHMDPRPHTVHSTRPRISAITEDANLPVNRVLS